MNKFLGLIVFLGMISSNAHSTSLHPDTFSKQAELLTWNMDKDSFVGSRVVEDGFVKVNAITKVASVTVNLENNCPPGAMCIAYIPTYTLELPITKITTDGCGVVTYIAEKNDMPVDGSHDKMVIKDVSESICEMFYLAPTMVTLTESYFDRFQGRLVRAQSRLTAAKLQ